ncbi:ComF family protein [Candidatus Woesebacteria bacterium]|nr:MAG: ComF family protein [Candidatus Woesebacteria bacterium]
MDGLTSLWEYTGVIKKAIGKLKFQFATEIANELTKGFVISMRSADKPLPINVTLIPIPLHRIRKNWRGFNQVEIIGQHLAKYYRWGFEPDLLVRHANTLPQSKLAKDERSKNVLGIFSVSENKSVQNANFVLLDDVWTTGSTMKEATKVLKRHGSGKVWGITLAH